MVLDEEKGKAARSGKRVGKCFWHSWADEEDMIDIYFYVMGH